MEHVVFFPAHDGSPAFRRLASLEEAVRLVEHLRNVEGVDHVSVHALSEVPLAFKAYYRVEMATDVGQDVGQDAGQDEGEDEGLVVPVLVETPQVDVPLVAAPTVSVLPLPEQATQHAAPVAVEAAFEVAFESEVEVKVEAAAEVVEVEAPAEPAPASLGFFAR